MSVNSKCPNPACDAVSKLEIVEAYVTGSKGRERLVQCSSCGTVVGTLLSRQDQGTLQDLKKRLDDVEDALQKIASSIEK